MDNLWDKVEQILNPDKWREKKMLQMRGQMGYDAAPMRNQGDTSISNPIMSDSLPLEYYDRLPLTQGLKDLYNKPPISHNQFELGPDKMSEDYFNLIAKPPWKGKYL